MDRLVGTAYFKNQIHASAELSEQIEATARLTNIINQGDGMTKIIIPLQNGVWAYTLHLLAGKIIMDIEYNGGGLIPGIHYLHVDGSEHFEFIPSGFDAPINTDSYCKILAQ